MTFYPYVILQIFWDENFEFQRKIAKSHLKKKLKLDLRKYSTQIFEKIHKNKYNILFFISLCIPGFFSPGEYQYFLHMSQMVPYDLLYIACEWLERKEGKVH